MTTADFIAITTARLKAEAKLENFKPKLYAVPPVRRAEPTIHDTLAAHPEMIHEPWVQRVLDMYHESKI